MFYNFFSESRGNVAKYGRGRQATDDYITRRMQFVYWRGYKQSEYVILTASPRQQWLPERASLLRYTYTACIVKLW